MPISATTPSRASFLRAALAVLLGAPLLVLAVSCGQGAEEESPTPTATRQAAPQDIRDIDFEDVREVRSLIDRLGGGEIVPSDIVYADLTGDGRPEAVVPISSGGTAGNLAFAVFASGPSGLEAILTVRPDSGRVSATVEDGALKETQPLYGPEDPLCCPSRLQYTYYRWDGQRLVVDRQETVENPSVKP